jgi:ribosomal protein S2
MRSIKLLVGAMADAVIEGRAMRGKDDEQMTEDDFTPEIDLSKYEDEEEGDERYLGKSTLAKLRDQRLFEDDEEGDNE